jgi:hypothetical protein
MREGRRTPCETGGRGGSDVVEGGVCEEAELRRKREAVAQAELRGNTWPQKQQQQQQQQQKQQQQQQQQQQAGRSHEYLGVHASASASSMSLPVIMSRFWAGVWLSCTLIVLVVWQRRSGGAGTRVSRRWCGRVAQAVWGVREV